MTGGHGLTRPLTATTRTQRRANKQPLRRCLTDLWMRFHSDAGISGLCLVEVVRGNAIDTRGLAKRAPDDHPRFLLNS
jgi:hypothetical protein